MTLEMEQGTYGRPAADAFDLPLWLAKRELRATESGAHRSRAPDVTLDHPSAPADELPPEYVPFPES